MAKPLNCPKDGTEAHTEEHGGGLRRFKLDVCPKCRGVWYDKGEITKITGDREVERLIVEYAVGSSTIACPRCGGVVARRPIGEVTVDVCLTCHGIWMDRGELEVAARTLAHDRPSDAAVNSESARHAGELSSLAWMSPGAKEALISSVSRGQIRAP